MWYLFNKSQQFIYNQPAKIAHTGAIDIVMSGDKHSGFQHKTLSEEYLMLSLVCVSALLYRPLAVTAQYSNTTIHYLCQH